MSARGIAVAAGADEDEPSALRRRVPKARSTLSTRDAAEEAFRERSKFGVAGHPVGRPCRDARAQILTAIHGRRDPIEGEDSQASVIWPPLRLGQKTVTSRTTR